MFPYHSAFPIGLLKIDLITSHSLVFFLELKTHIRKLDHETSDLKFLNNQYAHKVRCLEKDSKAKAERIQQLQEKNMQAVVQTPGKGSDLKYLPTN